MNKKLTILVCPKWMLNEDLHTMCLVVGIQSLTDCRLTFKSQLPNYQKLTEAAVLPMHRFCHLSFSVACCPFCLDTLLQPPSPSPSPGGLSLPLGG